MIPTNWNPPKRDFTRRWPHQKRQPFTHNLEVALDTSAMIHVIAECMNVTKKAAAYAIVQSFVLERPALANLIFAKYPQTMRGWR